ncbi:hypothetical protein B0H16DRAFT_1467454 [Mycena metata]|uniref:Uncharacterized protein n=1 Tax=Mycena metata TaxID=1033252 RepID=A0AAD7I3X6_9AGAR|nr:hypothetical protein B0H16DRAFT_1467454 [Mycena metata]
MVGPYIEAVTGGTAMRPVSPTVPVDSLPREIGRVRVPGYNPIVLCAQTSLGYSLGEFHDPRLPFDVVTIIVEFAADDDSSITTAKFIIMRNAFRLVSKELYLFINSSPRFWSRLVISPRAPLPFLQECVVRSASEKLFVSYHATERSPALCTLYAGLQCSFNDYVVDSAHFLSLDMGRCVELFVETDSPRLLETVLDCLFWTKPTFLRTIQTTYRMASYHHFRLYGIQFFNFSSFPAISAPFRAYTHLTWLGASVSAPTVTFHTDNDAHCEVLHPHGRPLVWDEFMVVLTSSMVVSDLILDCLDYVPTPGRITCSPPLYSLRTLILVFHGNPAMASAVSRFNIPGLDTLKVVFVDPGDVDCLSMCGALLVSTQEFVFDGHCPPNNGIYRLFSMMHRMLCLDFRLVPAVFFYCFVFASRKVSPVQQTNWQACPELKRVLVSGVPLVTVRDLILNREAAGDPALEYLFVENLDDGQDEFLGDWIRSRVELVIV